MIYELNHFGIFVRDADASLAFYRALDARIVFHHSSPDSGLQIVYLQLAGSMIELIYAPDPGPDAVFGINHLAFMSDDIDSDFDRLVAAGCSAAVPPRIAATGNGRIAFVERPDGARLELLQREVEFRTPGPGLGLITAFDHYGYRVDDLDEAAAFFTHTVGMAPVPDSWENDSETPQAFYAIRSDVLRLEASPQASAGFSHIALRVTDIKAALTTLAERGVVAAEPRVVPDIGDGRRAVLTDPDGVRVELLN
ncbi:VOC family protein [Mycetocola sp.]|uniref:VOC family protein n=1 Tax=Mycetocola sp. TaxID=1871042 RepID=UPI0039894684